MSRAERRQYQRMMKGQDPYAQQPRGGQKRPPQETGRERAQGLVVQSRVLAEEHRVAVVVGLAGLSVVWANGAELALLVGAAAAAAAIGLLVVRPALPPAAGAGRLSRWDPSSAFLRASPSATCWARSRSGWSLRAWPVATDPRTVGSQRTGATNTVRALGPGRGLVVGLLDVAKGLGLPRPARRSATRWASSRSGWRRAAAWPRSPVISGRCSSASAAGRGVATAAGGFLVPVPLALLIVIPIIGAVVAVTRYVSLGSIAGAISAPLVVAALYLNGNASGADIAYSALVGALVVLAHADNIARLRAGTERRIGDPRPGEPPPAETQPADPMAGDGVESAVATLPNLLGLFRLAATPVLVVLLLRHSPAPASSPFSCSSPPPCRTSSMGGSPAPGSGHDPRREFLDLTADKVLVGRPAHRFGRGGAGGGVAGDRDPVPRVRGGGTPARLRPASSCLVGSQLVGKAKTVVTLIGIGALLLAFDVQTAARPRWTWSPSCLSGPGCWWPGWRWPWYRGR